MGRAANAIAWTAGAGAVVTLLANLGGGRRARRRAVLEPGRTYAYGPRAPRRGRASAPATEAPARTPFASRADFVRQLADAYRAAGAPAIAVPLLVAHSALATGFGRNVWNRNIGVLRAGPDYAGASVDLRTREWTGTGYVEQVGRFRAYASLADSARDLLRLLGAARYAGARAQLDAGDAGWYEALGRAGFYTEPADRHAARYRRVLAVVARAT